jgi:endonuclease-3
VTSDPASPSESTPPVGTYVILLALERPSTVEVGALGAHDLPAGGYAYVGSAFGPGGLGRVDRHREVANGDRSVRHWHVDYLLGHSACSVVTDRRLPDVDAECLIARALLRPDASHSDGRRTRDSSDGSGDPTADTDAGRPILPVEGFGASDCDCPGHLVYRDTVGTVRVAVADAVTAVTGAGGEDGRTDDDGVVD